MEYGASPPQTQSIYFLSGISGFAFTGSLLTTLTLDSELDDLECKLNLNMDINRQVVCDGREVHS
jgi:hypothetical protein